MKLLKDQSIRKWTVLKIKEYSQKIHSRTLRSLRGRDEYGDVSSTRRDSVFPKIIKTSLNFVDAYLVNILTKNRYLNGANIALVKSICKQDEMNIIENG